MSYNKISSLPDDVVRLQLMERLDLTNNGLAILPFTLGLLPHLKTVQVRLQLLERLDLTNKDLAILPFTLGLLSHLKTVQVRLQLLERLDLTNNDLAISASCPTSRLSR